MTDNSTPHAGPSGTVTVTGHAGATRVFTILPTSLARYRAFLRSLHSIALDLRRKQQLDLLADASSKAAAAFEKFKASKSPADERAYADADRVGRMLADTVGRTAGDPPSPVLVDEARWTVEGTIRELLLRARTAHPDLVEADLRTIVNETNYVEVREQLDAIDVEPPKTDDTKSTPSN